MTHPAASLTDDLAVGGATTDLTRPTCRLVTLGCKVNQYETQLVQEAL